MKLLAVGFLLIGCAFAFPQYNSGGNKRPSSSSGNKRPPFGKLPHGCKIEYITVSEIIEVETVEKECYTKNERICDTKYRKKCYPYTDRECHTEYVNHCETKYRKKCLQRYREIDEYVEIDDCKDRYVRKCDSHWVDYGAGEKRWEEDPTNCKDLPNTECKTKQQLRKKKVPYQDCQDEPWQDCNKRPKQKCQNVIKENCKNEPYQDCHDKPYTECDDKHVKKPQSVRRKRPVRVCENGGGGYTRTRLDDNGKEIDEDDFETFDPKTEEDFLGSSSKNDGIVFGNGD